MSIRSRSIFMRPPRPWPSWRRAMSRSIAARSSSRPAGRPSTMQVRPGPWDSPAVTTRSGTPKILRAAAPEVRSRGPWHVPLWLLDVDEVELVLRRDLARLGVGEVEELGLALRQLDRLAVAR